MLSCSHQPLGLRKFCDKNPLGNVLVAVSDWKEGEEGVVVDGVAEYYEAEVVSASDYYPFGQSMPGRNYQSSNNYRFGFNGKEKDSEGEFGNLTHYDYGFRIYNPSIARFLSVDPLRKFYPMLTPYQFASNRPIDGLDLDGLEYLDAEKSFYNISFGTVWLKPNVVKRWYPSLYDNPNFDGGTTPSGQDYIGKTLPIGSFVASEPSSNINDELNFDPTLSPVPSTNPIRDHQRSKDGTSPVTRRNDGEFDRRATKRARDWQEVTSSNPAALNPASRILLVYQAYALYKDIKKSVDGFNDLRESRIQSEFLSRTFDDINSAIEQGLIPPTYQTTQALSQIANILFQGNTNGASSELEQVALVIAESISGTAENAFILTLGDGTELTIPQSSGELYETLEEQYNSSSPRESPNLKRTIIWKSQD